MLIQLLSHRQETTGGQVMASYGVYSSGVGMVRRKLIHFLGVNILFNFKVVVFRDATVRHSMDMAKPSQTPLA